MQQQNRDVENQADEIPLRDVADPNVHWRQLFRQYDSDGDGRISIRELRSMIRSSRLPHGELPDDFVRNIMQLSDRDSDGYLDFNEFVNMIHHPQLRNVFGHYLQRYIKIIVPRQHYDVTGLSYSDGQYEEEYSCWPPAICMIIVSIIEFILYLYDALVNHTRGTGPIATQLIYNPHKRYEAWRFFSYMFVHIGSVHLVVNLVVQLLLGIPLEMVHRWWRVLLIYLAGVAAGSLGTSVADPSVYLAGASGGVYALIAAHLATLFMNWSEMEFAALQLVIFVCIVGTDVGTAIYNRYTLNLDENIGYIAHLGGAIAGLLVGIGILRNLEVRSWEKKLWWCAVVLYCILMMISILINIFWTEHFPPTLHK